MTKKATTIEHIEKALVQVKNLLAQVTSAAAQDIAALRSSKQDKLTGQKGQVVGFNATGNPVAQSAESLRGPAGAAGATGAAAGFGTPAATVDANTGTPSVTVTATGPDTAKVFSFVFKNLKGAKGDKGDTPALNNTVTSTSTTEAATANAVRQAYALADSKQGKPLKGSFTIPASGWSTDSTTGYTRYYDIAVPGVTANDRADIIIAPGSVNAAAACGFCPVSETLAGKVRIRASAVPTAAISAEYWIEKG